MKWMTYWLYGYNAYKYRVQIADAFRIFYKIVLFRVGVTSYQYILIQLRISSDGIDLYMIQKNHNKFHCKKIGFLPNPWKGFGRFEKASSCLQRLEKRFFGSTKPLLLICWNGSERKYLCGTLISIRRGGLVRNLRYRTLIIIVQEGFGTKPLLELSRKGSARNPTFYETNKGSSRVSGGRTI
jgi:hypothetical protein